MAANCGQLSNQNAAFIYFTKQPTHGCRPGPVHSTNSGRKQQDCAPGWQLQQLQECARAPVLRDSAIISFTKQGIVAAGCVMTNSRTGGRADIPSCGGTPSSLKCTASMGFHGKGCKDGWDHQLPASISELGSAAIATPHISSDSPIVGLSKTAVRRSGLHRLGL